MTFNHTFKLIQNAKNNVQNKNQVINKKLKPEVGKQKKLKTFKSENVQQNVILSGDQLEMKTLS